MDHLDQTARTARLDSKDHGESKEPEAPWALSDLQEPSDLRELLDQLGVWERREAQASQARQE